MGAHDHGHAHGSDPAGGARRSLRPLAIALAINTAFFVVELAGALASGSLALLADATHMLTDTASLGLALLAAWVAALPADETRTYGYHRAEVLGGLANGLFLLAVVAYVLFDAVRRFGDPPSVDPGIVVAVGIVGLLANLAAAFVLSGHRDFLNVEGAFVHLLADAAGSVGAIAAGAIIWVTGVAIVDPIVAVLISVLVLYATRDLLADSVNVLLQGTPRGIDVGEVRAALEGTDGVVDAHHVHVWALDSVRVALTAHVVVAAEADPDAVLDASRTLLADRFGIDHATVQLESEGYTETVAMACHAPDE